jgi:PAS domain S-box-containing protein
MTTRQPTASERETHMIVLGVAALPLNSAAVGLPRMSVSSLFDFSLLPAFEQTAVGLALLTLDGAFVAANPAVCRFTGRSIAELKMLNLLEVVLPADREICADNLINLSGGTRATVSEVRYLRLDGTTIWVRKSLSILERNDLSEPYLLGVCEDVSDRKATEAKLKNLQIEHQHTVDFNPQIPWTADPQGKVLEMSGRYYEKTGLPHETAFGDGWARVCVAEDLERMQTAWGHSIATGEPYDIEHRILTASGKDCWMRTRAFPRRDQAGNIVRWYGTTEDINDRKLAQDAVLISEKLAAIGRLAGSIAHEINNPLEAVTNLVHLARTSTETAEIDRYLGQADFELRRVSAITSKTLRFHRQYTRKEAVRFSQLIDAALLIFDQRLRSLGVAVELREQTQRSVVCLQGEIGQVLNNLIANAIDALPQERGRLLIRCRDGRDWRDDRKGMVITVADNGSGMSSEVQRRVFEPFFSTKGILGTGIGLWISAEIVQRHQGKLKCRSWQGPHGRGTVFSLFLPY